jgi:cytochrome c oxidase subunit IV
MVPPSVLLVLVALMALESDYTWLTRITFFGQGS